MGPKTLHIKRVYRPDVVRQVEALQVLLGAMPVERLGSERAPPTADGEGVVCLVQGDERKARSIDHGYE